MRICFIWVSRFKNLTNFGINLCNDYKFSFDLFLGVLKKSNELPLPTEIFGSNIHDITAILGINGAGKSNALELICLALKSAEKIDARLLIVYESRGRFFYINKTHRSIHAEFEAKEKKDHKDFKELNVVYFSNVFDGNPLDLGKNVQDLSANIRYGRDNFKSRRTGPSEIIQQLSFIHSEGYERVRIDTPKTLEIKVPRSIQGRQGTEENHPHWRILKEIDDLHHSTRKTYPQNKSYLAATFAIQAMFLYVVLDSGLMHDQLREEITNALAKVTEDISCFQKLLRITMIFFEQHPDLDRQSSVAPLASLINIAINLDDIFLRLGARLDDSIRTDSYNVTLDFSREKHRPYVELACMMERLHFGVISWTGISSGQKAYLNLFSSVWSTLNNTETAKKTATPTLLCIDEADLYLHPQWQVEFIERLITCLPSLSNGKKQIVITTHSPILVSDLPNQCLISLPSPSKIHSESALRTDHLKTFGANLFDIYSATFGLSGQRTGNLSAKYISNILAILDCDNITRVQREALFHAASIIDDDLIYAHILKRIYSQ